MRVCFIVTEIFAFKRFGGYGKLVRMLAEGLQNKSVEVSAVTWRDPGQRFIENVGGITVLSFPYNYTTGGTLSHMFSYLKARPLYRLINADVYHSIEVSIETYLAKREMPYRKHLIHFQDPYEKEDFELMAKVDSSFRLTTRKKLEFLANLYVLRKACDKADGLYTQARTFISKINRLYALKSRDVGFLPNPVSIPEHPVKKNVKPTVCFLGRWDPQKRVEIFLNLANKFPHVDFIAMGKGLNEEHDKYLRGKFRDVENLNMTGFVSEKEKSEILGRSWIMINTSIREGLPLAFLEALAHKTPILSSVNPDQLASNFGLHVNHHLFESGLETLLRNDLWKEKGEEGYRYVSEVHEVNKVTDQCLNIYRKVLDV